MLLLPVEAQIARIRASSSPGALLQLASTNNEPLFTLIKRSGSS